MRNLAPLFAFGLLICCADAPDATDGGPGTDAGANDAGATDARRADATALDAFGADARGSDVAILDAQILEDSGTDAGDHGVRFILDEVCPERASAECASRLRCDRLFTGEVAECEAERTRLCRDSLEDAVAALGTRLRLRPEGRMECTNPPYECTDFNDAEDRCAGLFEPMVELGGACFETLSTSECREGFCRLEDTCPGVCTTWRAEGEACTEDWSSDQRCGPGLSCDESSFTCTPRIVLGNACSNDIACIEGSRCDSGRCTAIGQAGEPCGPICADQLVCNFQDDVCVDPRDPDNAIASGERGCFTYLQCPLDHHCVIDRSFMPGFCEPARPDGARCETGSVRRSAPFCLDGSRCLEGVGLCESAPRTPVPLGDACPVLGRECEAGTRCGGQEGIGGCSVGRACTCDAFEYVDEGDACGSADVQCRYPNGGLYCAPTSMTCERRALPGEDCTQDRQCTSRACTAGTCEFRSGTCRGFIAF